MDISVVIPVYGCRAALFDLHKRLVDTLSSITEKFEIILVDDNCPQGSWEDIYKICNMDKRVVGLQLSRNFGQIKAITAGLDNAQGEWVVVMDCDLQDRPEEIINLYNKTQEGYDVVFGSRLERKDTFLTKFLSRFFYKVYDYFTDGNFNSNLCNFSISNKKVIDAYCSMREQNRAYTIFIKWLGFKSCEIELLSDERYEGKSSYDIRKKLRMAFEFITAQSNKPLMFSIKLGFLSASASLIYIFYLIYRYSFGFIIPGWTTIVVSIYLMGGLILSSIGILGVYIGNIFNETKKRPIYVVKNILNKD